MRVDIVLRNWLGCELERKEIENYDEVCVSVVIAMFVHDLVINIGDTITIEQVN